MYRNTILIALFVIGTLRSISVIIYPTKSYNNFISAVSPLAQVFVQPGFFIDKKITIKSRTGENIINYKNSEKVPDNRMLYSLMQFPDLMPTRDFKLIAEHSLCQKKLIITNEKKLEKIESIEVEWGNKKRWHYQCK